jgi:alpha-1,3-mannosyl-glycoprotein beta-1,2-N-acetylglucosaminyltransferase
MPKRYTTHAKAKRRRRRASSKRFWLCTLFLLLVVGGAAWANMRHFGLRPQPVATAAVLAAASAQTDAADAEDAAAAAALASVAGAAVAAQAAVLQAARGATASLRGASPPGPPAFSEENTAARSAAAANTRLAAAAAAAAAVASVAAAAAAAATTAAATRAPATTTSTAATTVAAAAAAAAAAGSHLPRPTASGGCGEHCCTTVLMVCYNRPAYLKRALERLLAVHPLNRANDLSTGHHWRLLVSQDGDNAGVAGVVAAFAQKAAAVAPDMPVVHIKHRQGAGSANGYEALAKHFGWALRQAFGTAWTNPAPELRNGYGGGGPCGARAKAGGKGGADRVIVMEDDLDAGADFFGYFEAAAAVLDADPGILAASAWNDNGMAGFVADPRALVKSEFFPGLGWMLNARAWRELAPKWPAGYWDDWLREPAQRKGRFFIRPEVSRSRTFGRSGVSSGQFFDDFLARTVLDEVRVPWVALAKGGELDFLLGATRYDARLALALEGAALVGGPPAAVNAAAGSAGSGMGSGANWAGASWAPSAWLDPASASGSGALRVEYAEGQFVAAARQLGIMTDIKAGVPRTAYRGVVAIRRGHAARLVLLVPQSLSLVQVALAVPGATVHARTAQGGAMGQYGAHGPALAFDGSDGTFFWSDAPVGPGDSVEVVFPAARKLTSLAVLTGVSGKDMLASGDLQVKFWPPTGRRANQWVGVGALVNGEARADPAKLQQQSVVSVRVLVSKAQTSWLRVREFVVAL